MPQGANFDLCYFQGSCACLLALWSKLQQFSWSVGFTLCVAPFSCTALSMRFSMQPYCSGRHKGSCSRSGFCAVSDKQRHLCDKHLRTLQKQENTFGTGMFSLLGFSSEILRFYWLWDLKGVLGEVLPTT